MVLSSHSGDETRFSLRLEERDLRPGRPAKVFRKRFPEPHEVRLHYHESLELNLCTGLAGRMLVGGRACDLGQQPLIVLPPRTLHAYDIDRCAGWMDIIHIFPQFVDAPLNGGALARMFGSLVPASLSCLATMARVVDFASYLQDVPCDAPGGELPKRLMLAARILDLLSCLLTAQSSGSAAAMLQLPAAVDDHVLLRLIEWTECRLDHPPSLAEAAREMAMGRSAFCR
jgi:hypothetical protein